MLALILPLVVGLTIKFNVRIESHPLEPMSVSDYAPVVVLFTPLKKYDCPWQILSLMFPVVVGFTVKFKVRIESQPLEPTKVSKYAPLVVRLTPLNK